MATLYISEYAELARDSLGNVIQAGKEPALAQQTVTTSGTTAASAAFQVETRFIRVVSTGIEHLNFGVSTVTATTSNTAKIEADTPEFFGVSGGTYLAAINGT